VPITPRTMSSGRLGAKRDAMRDTAPDTAPPASSSGGTIDVTLRNQKVTPARGEEAIVASKPANLADTGDEPTRAMSPQESSAYSVQRPKFAAPNDPNARTTVTPSRSQPANTLRDMPAASNWDVPDALAATAPPRAQKVVQKVEEPSDQLAADPPTGEIQKAKVWVATHKAPPDPDPRLILLREPDSQRAASFRVMRHRLEERGAPRTIAVTSAEPGEGKTTCAANLAMALGECGRARVLLVEANLRSPALAALFGFLPPECFAQQLTRHRERPLDPWSVVEVYSPSLHVAAVKPGPENENRPLLDGIAFGIAMDMLKRSGYDYLVIDTPPVLGSADVNLIEDYADGVLLTAWSRQSSGRALRRAIDQLSPAKILGLTLLDV
jgi:Mrp family chromosome partitioning ATPase